MGSTGAGALRKKLRQSRRSRAARAAATALGVLLVLVQVWLTDVQLGLSSTQR